MSKSTGIAGLSATMWVQRIERGDIVSLTDIGKLKNSDDPRFIMQSWMRTRSSIDFLESWDTMNNPGFNRMKFDTVGNKSRSNA